MNPSTPVLTIDLKALRSNYRLIEGRLAAGCRVAPVVKTNAYGLGVVRTASEFNALKCNDFFVFTPEEGVELRSLLPTAALYILCGYPQGWSHEYVKYSLVPCLSSPDEVERYRQTAKSAGRKLPAAIQFDTGMNRLGFGMAETEKLLHEPGLLEGIDLKMVMSHFLGADEKDNPHTRQQAEKFSAIAERFPQAQKSLSNSSGIFRSPEYHYDLARPGIALYGLNPTPETKNPAQPVVQLHVPVLQTRTVKKGDVVGYGATYSFEKDTRMATVWLGYADGFLRALGNRGSLFWKGHACPVRGRVSMNLVTVSLENIPEHEAPQEGDSLEVLGPHQNIDTLAASAGTIGYEILTGLGQRYRRAYI